MGKENSQTKDKLISIVIPVYNEELNLEWHHNKLESYLNKNKINYEILYVNDGSKDKSLDIIRELAKDYRTHFISFTRNFGKEAATSAGIKKAQGAAIIIMDADGQHPMELIATFIAKWEKGYKLVVGVRKSNTGAGFIKAFGSKAFYLILHALGDSDSAVAGSTDFRLIDKQVAKEYNKLTEHNRITRNLIDWLGYKRKDIPFHANERRSGKASYSNRKLIKLGIDGIVKHSTKPLKFIGSLGFVISILSVLTALFVIIEQYILKDPLGLAVTGVALLALFLSFLVGIVLVCQGLLALYIENVYFETQNRPLYVIEEEE